VATAAGGHSLAALMRLKLENSVFANQSFGYDLNGNRHSNGSNAYTYRPHTNAPTKSCGIEQPR